MEQPLRSELDFHNISVSRSTLMFPRTFQFAFTYAKGVPDKDSRLE